MESFIAGRVLKNHNCSSVGTESAVIFSVTGFSCSLSIIGAIFILYSYARLSTIRDGTRLLLMFLTISDLLTAAGILIMPSMHLRYLHVHESEKVKTHISKVCKSQSFITTFSSMASFFWTFVIAVHIASRERLTINSKRGKTVLALAILLCWGVPGIICCLALKSDVLGINMECTGPWCWIRGDLDETTMITWMLLAGKGWEGLCYFAATNLYILPKLYAWIRRRRRRNYRKLHCLATHDDVTENKHIRSHTSAHRNNLLYLLMALYILRIWGSSRFVINILSKNLNWDPGCTTQYILLILQSYGDSGQGFWNFVIFCCMDKAVKFRDLCRCCGREAYNIQADQEQKPLIREMVESVPRT